MEALAFADVHEVSIAIRSGGHCFAGYSSTGGLLIDVTLLDQVQVDGDTAVVGTGTRVGAMTERLAKYNRVVPGGSCPSVGVGGTTLGGGLGVLGRLFGLTCDHLLAAQVVLADGRIVTTDEQREPDLFWALRGAGAGNFGVVTSFVFRTRPSVRMTNFYYVWPYRDAATVVEQWQRWAPEAPDELAAGLALTSTDHLDEPPFVEVYGAMAAGWGETKRLLDEFSERVGARPERANVTELSYLQTAHYQAGLLSAVNEVVQTPQGPVQRQGFRFTKSEFFDRLLPAEAITRLVEQFDRDRAAGQYRGLEFAPWAGGYCRVPATATAFAHRTQRFSLKHAILVAPAASAERKHAAHRWVTESWASVHPWGCGQVYPNFPDPDLTDWATAYYGVNLPRLTEIKARYDPGNRFCFEQSIPVGNR